MVAVTGTGAGPHGSKYEALVARAKAAGALSTVVVHPCDETSLGGAIGAAWGGLIRPILVGSRDKIVAVAAENRIDISACEIVDVAHSA